MTTTILALALLTGQADVRGQETKAEVRSLLRQLGDDQLATREAAEQALVKLGPAALDHLPPITDRMSAEVAQRLRRIQQVLQKAAAEQSGQARRVTLAGEMPLSDAFTAIEKQTGNRILSKDAGAAVVTTDFENVTFWEAVDRLLDQAGLTVYNYGGEPGAITVVSRAENEVPRAARANYQGIFRFESVNLIASRDLRSPTNSTLRLKMDVSWEPRVKPVSLELALADIQAVDENNQPLPLDSNRATLRPSVEGTVPAIELEIPLQLPPRDVQQIASLKGRLSALIPGSTEAFEFTQLADAKEVEIQKAGATVTLEQVRKNLELYEVRMRVRFDEANNALESHRGWVYQNEAYVIDADGNRVDNFGSQTTAQKPNEVGMSYLFDFEDGIENYTFVYETPTIIMKTTVPFELTKIDLP